MPWHFLDAGSLSKGSVSLLPASKNLHTFRHGLACFLSEMATARFGEEHAFPSQVWLSPNARDEPPSDPRSVIRIARKFFLKNSILRDSAIEQK